MRSVDCTGAREPPPLPQALACFVIGERDHTGREFHEIYKHFIYPVYAMKIAKNYVAIEMSPRLTPQ